MQSGSFNVQLQSNVTEALHTSMASIEQPPARGGSGQEVSRAPALENNLDISISASERVVICGEIEHVLYLLEKKREMRNITGGDVD
jgi:hypothetical protein